MFYVNQMRKRILTLLILSSTLVLLLSGSVFADDEAQKAWLRMSVDDSIYVGADPDPWMQDSYVVYSGPTSSLSINITVTNFKGREDVYQIVLFIVTNDTGAINGISVNGSSVSIDPSDWTYGPDSTGPPMYADPGAPTGTYLGDMPAHGVYNDPAAAWVEYRSGKNLTAKDTPGDSMLFMITISFSSPDPGHVKLHFDTYGWVGESCKEPVIIDCELDATFSPFSHDITILVPELTLPLLATASLALSGYLLLKRKLAKT